MSVGSPTAGTWSSSQWRPDNEFETDRLEPSILGVDRLAFRQLDNTQERIVCGFSGATRS